MRRALGIGFADLLGRQRFRLEDIGDGFDIVEHNDRYLRLRQRCVGCHRDDAIVIGMQKRFAVRGAIDFELGMRVTLEAFDDDEIGGT